MPADLPIHDQPLPYESRLAERPAAAVDLLVVHCTELPDLATARDFGERVLYASGGGNSGHYYIDRDGALYRYVAPTRVAHHTRGYNERSVGVELVNRGRWPNWHDTRHQAMTEPYTAAQIDALVALIGKLRRDLPSLRYVAGHEDLDTADVPASDDAAATVKRKRDPGPLFPWPSIEATGLERLRPDA